MQEFGDWLINSSKCCKLYFFKLFILILTMIGCENSPSVFEDHIGQERCQRFTPEERQALVPNEVFQKVCEVKGPELDELFLTDIRNLDSQNSEGDTPFGFAIKIREFALAAQILQNMTLDQFTHLNQAGESYVFLAAKFGSAQLIELIADRFLNGRANDLDRLGWFRRLDQPNLLGQRALHVASDRQVARSLQVQYRRGTLAFEWFRFTLHRDLEGNSFLHSAARESRFDVLDWGAELFCRAQVREPHESHYEWWIFRKIEGVLNWAGEFTGSTARGMKRFVQTFGPDLYDLMGLDSPWMLMVNARNHLEETPLHIAMRERDLKSVQALLGCEYIDFLLPDAEGKLPLHRFLSELDRHQPELSANEMNIFEMVLARETKMRMWPIFPAQRASYINFQDERGESSLHAAARLMDSRFFERLVEQGGDVFLPNQHAQRPIDIFNQTQQLRRNNPQ